MDYNAATELSQILQTVIVKIVSANIRSVLDNQLKNILQPVFQSLGVGKFSASALSGGESSAGPTALGTAAASAASQVTAFGTALQAATTQLTGHAAAATSDTAATTAGTTATTTDAAAKGLSTTVVAANTTAFTTDTTAVGANAAAQSTGGLGGLLAGIGSTFLSPFKLIGSLFGFEHGGIVPSAQGGWALPSLGPGGVLAQLHSNEMVLPANISQGLQAAIAGGGLGAGAPVVLNISAIDSQDVRRFFTNNGNLLVAAMNKAMRNGSFPRVA